jgi:predicted dehydrogenase/nucleoside-diphosphate-sugar epimerase
MRLLLLGAGAVVAEYYAPALRILGWERDAVVVDPSPRALAGVRAAWPAADLRQVGFGEALDDASIARHVDGVVVAVPNSLHEAAACLALERGLHVLCEKPLAPSREACLRLADTARRAERVLAVGMVRRLLPSLSMLRQALAQGLIGDVTAIDVEDGEPFAWMSESGAFFRRENGGVLADMGVHYLDFLEELVGELVPVRYQDDAVGGVEANAELDLATRGGVSVRMALSRTRRLRNTLVVRGLRGELIAEKDVFDSCLWRSTLAASATRLVPQAEWPPTLQACFARQLVDFQHAIASGAPPAVTAERAASTVGLLEWAYGRQVRGHQPEQRRTHADAPRLPRGSSVCITGATGFIGSHLVERLVEDSAARVTAPVRSYRTCAEIGRFPVHMPRWNILDLSSVEAAVEGAQFVVHLAYGRDGPDGERVTVEGTRNVVQAAIRARCESVVVLSSVYVFGQPAAHVDETWPYRPAGGAYGLSKVLMERECLRLAETVDTTRIVILCPSCVFGPRGSTYAEMPARMTSEGSFALIEDGRGRANYTYADNLIDAIILAATSDTAHGQRFIINDGMTTWREYLRALLGERALQLPSFTPQQLLDLHRARPRPTMTDVARLIVTDPRIRATAKDTRVGAVALGVADRLAPNVRARLRRSAAVNVSASSLARPVNTEAVPPVWLAALFGPEQTVYSASKAAGVLGWRPRVSFEAGMRATREWLAANVGS